METRPEIFKWRQTEPGLTLCAVRWYLRYSLSLRDVEELLEERGLHVDHTLSRIPGLDGGAVALDHQCPTLGGPEAGLGGSAERDHRARRSRQPVRRPEHPAAGNSPGQLADPGAGEGTAGRPRPHDAEGQ